MGVVGSLPVPNEENTTNLFDEQICSGNLPLKELQTTAEKLDNGRVKKLRTGKARTYKLNHAHIREQLRRQVEELELRQNHLLSTVQQLRLYKQELEGVYQQRLSLQECSH